MDRAIARRSLPSRSNASSGFTLLELLIVISIATILLSVAVPALSRFVLDSQRSAAINELLAAMYRARTEAIATRRTISLCAASSAANGSPSCTRSGGWETGWLIFVDPGADGALDATDTVLLRHGPVGGGISLRGNSRISRRLTYRLSGVTANNGRIAFCDRRGWTDEARIIVVSVAGRVRALTRAQDSNTPLSGCDP